MITGPIGFNTLDKSDVGFIMLALEHCVFCKFNAIRARQVCDKISAEILAAQAKETGNATP